MSGRHNVVVVHFHGSKREQWQWLLCHVAQGGRKRRQVIVVVVVWSRGTAPRLLNKTKESNGIVNHGQFFECSHFCSDFGLRANTVSLTQACIFQPLPTCVLSPSVAAVQIQFLTSHPQPFLRFTTTEHTILIQDSPQVPSSLLCSGMALPPPHMA